VWLLFVTGLAISECDLNTVINIVKETQLDKLKVENMQIDQVRSFIYLGAILNGNNTLEEVIRERIVKGNKNILCK
jgi:hypothetical protein